MKTPSTVLIIINTWVWMGVGYLSSSLITLQVAAFIAAIVLWYSLEHRKPTPSPQPTNHELCLYEEMDGVVVSCQYDTTTLSPLAIATDVNNRLGWNVTPKAIEEMIQRSTATSAHPKPD